MKRFADISLQFRLLASYSLIALLTVIAVIVGISSLGSIQENLAATTASINENIEAQNNQTKQAAQLRDLIAIIGASQNNGELEASRNTIAGLAGEEKVLFETFIRQKADQIQAEEEHTAFQESMTGAQNKFSELQLELNQTQKQGQDVLTNLKMLTSGIADDAQFEAVIAIGDAVSEIKKDKAAKSIARDLQAIEDMVQESMASVITSLSIQGFGVELDAMVKDGLLTDDTARVDYYLLEVGTLLGNAREGLAELPESEAVVNVSLVLDQLDDLINKMLITKGIMLGAQGNMEKAQINMQLAKMKMGQTEQSMKEISSRVFSHLSQLESDLVASAEQTKENALADMQASNDLVAGRKVMQYVLGLIAVVFAVCITLMISRIIMNPIQRAVELADAIRKGDLSKRLKMASNDEIGRLAKALDEMADGLEEKAKLANAIASGDLTREVPLASERDMLGKALATMNDNLHQLIDQISQSSLKMDSGSNLVSDSSQSVSQGATEQASSLEEISSSMTELGSTTSTNAENAGLANQLAEQAHVAANKGNKQMQEMVAAMEEINMAGQNISKINKVIDEIAFQINLLALNAAVEAARAGKHGRGFAVVAEEVRNLAARSAQAARETAELIEGSVEKTSNGTAIANQTAEALQEIVNSVSKVTGLIGEIAAASRDQAEGIAQVNNGLTQIEQITQQNTSNAEESAAASAELFHHAAKLKDMLASFTLKDQPAMLASSHETVRALPH